MSFLTKAQRYEMLCGIRSRANPNLPGGPLSIDEEQFLQDYAMEMAQDFLRDPECQAAMDRIYESRWAHRFD